MKQYKEVHRAKPNIKLSLGTGPYSLVRHNDMAYEMITILKAPEYKIGSKIYDHRTLATVCEV